jgi:hypothetical protein
MHTILRILPEGFVVRATRVVTKCVARAQRTEFLLKDGY